VIIMCFYIYILSHKPRGVLYIGITNNLARRIYEHKHGIIEGFSRKYNLVMLVYTKEYKNPNDGIAREKQLKNWHRDWKINLIETVNPNWEDLYGSII
jgi:putative endonuclease